VEAAQVKLGKMPAGVLAQGLPEMVATVLLHQSQDHQSQGLAVAAVAGAMAAM
jgi:hypothetical protein